MLGPSHVGGRVILSASCVSLESPCETNTLTCGHGTDGDGFVTIAAHGSTRASHGASLRRGLLTRERGGRGLAPLRARPGGFHIFSSF
jgi:hypothetical protein